MDRQKLLEIIKEHYSFKYWAETLDASEIMDIVEWYRNAENINSDCWYLESLVSHWWEWISNTYLDYYDNNLHKIILIEDVEYEQEYENADEIADYILDLDDIYSYWTQKKLPTLLINN